MEDKEVVTEGQAPAPKVNESPAGSPETEPPAEATAEVDKDLSEWATNKGFSEEDLKNPVVLKATKMAQNAEGMIGKNSQPPAQPASEDVDLDKLLDEIMGDSSAPQIPQETVRNLDALDESQLSDTERATLQVLKAQAEKAGEAAAKRIIAPYESDLRKKTYKAQFDQLIRTYGAEVIKNSPAILEKAIKTGVSLEDATILVLNANQLKQAQSKGIEEGKEIKQKEISQQVEQTKKADSSPLPDYSKLSLADQRKVVEELQAKGLRAPG